MEGLALSRAMRKPSQNVSVECWRRQKRLSTEMTGLKTERERENLMNVILHEFFCFALYSHLTV